MLKVIVFSGEVWDIDPSLLPPQISMSKTVFSLLRTLVAFNLIADIACMLIDPRIKESLANE
jgi:hypothetical protein